MPGRPDGYSIRPATMNDVDAVADVLAAEDLTITGEVLYDPDFVRFQWTKPGVDLAKDAWVVESGPSVIGHAIVIPDGDEVVTSWGVVLPRHRGVGVGSALLDLVQGRGAERLRDGGRLQHSVTDSDVAGAQMVTARGFEHVRSFRHMQIDLDGPITVPSPPPGVEIRTIDPERDLRSVHSIFVEAFRDEWNYRVIPFEEWLQIDVEDESFDPSLWLLATEGTEAVGRAFGLHGERPGLGRGTGGQAGLARPRDRLGDVASLVHVVRRTRPVPRDAQRPFGEPDRGGGRLRARRDARRAWLGHLREAAAGGLSR